MSCTSTAISSSDSLTGKKGSRQCTVAAKLKPYCFASSFDDGQTKCVFHEEKEASASTCVIRPIAVAPPALTRPLPIAFQALFVFQSCFCLDVHSQPYATLLRVTTMACSLNFASGAFRPPTAAATFATIHGFFPSLSSHNEFSCAVSVSTSNLFP